MTDDWIEALLKRYRAENMPADPVMEALLSSRLHAAHEALKDALLTDTPETARMKAQRALQPKEN